MSVSRNFLNESADNEHALVPVLVEVRDSLGALAVQVLASRENLSELSYSQMLEKLCEITADLHREYDRNRTNLHG